MLPLTWRWGSQSAGEIVQENAFARIGQARVHRALFLQKFLELLNRESGIVDDTAHRIRIHGIVPRDSQDTLAIAHHNMLALADDLESSLFERPHRTLMINAR
jgi:hypothetical protein